MKTRQRVKRSHRVTMSMMLALASAWASAQDKQDVIVDPCNLPEMTYAAKPGENIAPTDIKTDGFGGDVFWTFINQGNSCSGTTPNFVCAGLNVTVPPLDTAVNPASAEGKVTVAGTASNTQGAQGRFRLKVNNAPDADQECIRNYMLHVTSNGGGWGDPHLTTVDGVHYDFQSAGEFVALKSDDLEIQTRQSPVPTATVPITNPYTGITHCVAIYTAMAARVGGSRVSLQPSPGPEPDPKSMQLWINGKLVTLGSSPIQLSSGGDDGVSPSAGAAVGQGRFDGTVKKLADGNIEITNAFGTQIVVTPQYWDSQKVWYLNLNVYQTAATQGTMGRIAEGSWLPALADGTSLGPKPESDSERYEQLYEKFADSWRVTDSSSLFHYESGETTATHTVDEWPRNNPQTCGIQGGPTPVQPATEQVALQACANVTDATQKADCVFDVTLTGHTGFGRGYEIMQGYKPQGAGWQTQVVFPGTGSGDGPTKPDGKIPLWVWILILILILILIWILSRKKSTP